MLVVSWPKPRLGARQVVGIYDNAFLYSVLPRWHMDTALMLVLPNCRRNLPQSGGVGCGHGYGSARVAP